MTTPERPHPLSMVGGTAGPKTIAVKTSPEHRPLLAKPRGVIRTRADLVAALKVAAELEHSLLCQYLYASFSIHKSPVPGLTADLTETTRGWAMTLNLVARQEMEHLGMVFNLLAAIGEPPHLTRPAFPVPPEAFPLRLPLDLVKFDREALENFVAYEAPMGADPGAVPEEERDVLRSVAARAAARAAPSPRAHAALKASFGRFPRAAESIQQFYLEIDAGFQAVADDIGEKALFSGDPGEQVSDQDLILDDNGPAYDLDVVVVKDLATAHAAIWQIIEEGEGVAGFRVDSHYTRFRQTLLQLDAAGPHAWARDVMRNPTVTGTPDCDPITDATAAKAAEAFNLAYETMLLVMAHFYGRTGLTDAQKGALAQLGFFPMMTMVIRPVGEALVDLPSGNADGTRAGPPFEISPDFAVGSVAGDVQKVLANLDDLGRRAEALQGEVPRFAFIAPNVRRMTANFRAAFGPLSPAAPAATEGGR